MYLTLTDTLGIRDALFFVLYRLWSAHRHGERTATARMPCRRTFRWNCERKILTVPVNEANSWVVPVSVHLYGEHLWPKVCFFLFFWFFLFFVFVFFAEWVSGQYFLLVDLLLYPQVLKTGGNFLKVYEGLARGLVNTHRYANPIFVCNLEPSQISTHKPFAKLQKQAPVQTSIICPEVLEDLCTGSVFGCYKFELQKFRFFFIFLIWSGLQNNWFEFLSLLSLSILWKLSVWLHAACRNLRGEIV